MDPFLFFITGAAFGVFVTLFAVLAIIGTKP